MLEFLEKLFGKNEDGTPKALTFADLEAAAKADKSIKVADLSSGNYVSREKFDAKETELNGVKDQLATANNQIKSYKDMDIDGIKKSASDWEAKYTADTKALQDKLDAQERSHMEDRFFDQYKFTSMPAKKGIMTEFESKGFKIENGKFLGAEDFMKGLMENEDYKGAFVKDSPDSNGGNGQNSNGTNGQQGNGNVPFFSASSQSQTNGTQASTFGFGFSGVRKRPQQ